MVNIYAHKQSAEYEKLKGKIKREGVHTKPSVPNDRACHHPGPENNYPT